MVSKIKNNRVNTPLFIEMTKIVGGVVLGGGKEELSSVLKPGNMRH